MGLHISIPRSDVPKTEPAEPAQYELLVVPGKIELKHKVPGDEGYFSIEFLFIDQGGNEKLVWDNFTLKKQGLFHLEDLFLACGLGDSWTDDGFDIEDLFGATLQAEISVEEFEGRFRNKVAKLLK